MGAAQARGQGRAWAVAQGRGAQRSGATIASRVSKSLGSGARALRKCACDAMAKRQTVHVSVKLQVKGALTNPNCK
eukprot:5864514-Pleurochrysis_carterae.AAC.1